MTENERKAIDTLQDMITEGQSNGDVIVARDDEEELNTAIQALEEIQQYRAIGTVEEIQQKLKNMSLVIDTDRDLLNRYIAIGTIEEFKALKEKNEPKKPTEKELPYSEEVGLNSEWHCPACGSYVGYFTEGMNEPEQMEYCNVCGQHIAKDWSE